MIIQLGESYTRQKKMHFCKKCFVELVRTDKIMSFCSICGGEEKILAYTCPECGYEKRIYEKGYGEDPACNACT